MLTVYNLFCEVRVSLTSVANDALYQLQSAVHDVLEKGDAQPERRPTKNRLLVTHHWSSCQRSYSAPP